MQIQWIKENLWWDRNQFVFFYHKINTSSWNYFKISRPRLMALYCTSPFLCPFVRINFENNKFDLKKKKRNYEKLWIWNIEITFVIEKWKWWNNQLSKIFCLILFLLKNDWSKIKYGDWFVIYNKLSENRYINIQCWKVRNFEEKNSN